MRLTSFIVINKYDMKRLFVMLLLSMLLSSVTYAESLSYSPDQWPRRWNILINEMHQPGNPTGVRSNNQQYNTPQTAQRPARSPAWGVPPVAKPKSRRSYRPDYNTNSHIVDYSRYYGTGNAYYPGLAGYGMGSPFGAPLLVPGISPILAPGLTAPGIPFGVMPFNSYPYAYPYGRTYPYTGFLPGIGY